jgi:hypothetical protein
MQKYLIGGIVALLMAFTPLMVMAQAVPFDEEARSTATLMAQQVGATLVPGISAPSEQEPGAPASQPEEPEPEPTAEPTQEPTEEPTEEPVDEASGLPELVLTDVVEYTSQGVTFQAPADWTVATDMGADMPFFVEVPGTELFVSMEADAGLDFPSWLGVALFRSQAHLLIGEMGEGAQLDESATIFTEQNLPMAKLAFSGSDFGEEVGGALYVIAPNENAYIMVAGGPLDEWEYAKDGVDLIARSIVFDEDLITAVFVEGEPLEFPNADGTVQVTVPAGWYVMDTGDPQFPIMVAEPEVRYVVAVGGEEVFSGEFDDALLDRIPETGELDPAEYDALFADIVTLIEDSGSPIIVDEELSSVSSREGAATVRLVGQADLDDGLVIPVIFYIDLRVSSVGVVVVFGDSESAMSVESDLQQMLESVTSLE